MSAETKDRFSVQKLALLGMMTALVFASNYARIVMPIAIGGNTAFTLANILCCMSGLVLGPAGGLAAGLGSAIYDLTFPAYAAECWITFITKGTMGLVAGLAVKKALSEDKLTYPKALAGAALGCAAYNNLYFTKSVFYNGMLLESLSLPVALGVLPLKLPASIFNAAIALVTAPPIALALLRALKRSKLDRLLRE